MKLLAIDTSTSHCLVGLLTEKKIFEKTSENVREHNQIILPLIDELLSEAEVNLSDIDAFVLSAGPGSFTGLRLSSSILQAFAFSKQKPIIAISSLRVLAQTAFEATSKKQLLVLVDARMGDVYSARYVINGNNLAELVGDETTIKANEIEILADDYLVGDMIIRHPELFKINSNVITHPKISALLTLASVSYHEKLFLLPTEINPHYQSHLTYKKAYDE